MRRCCKHVFHWYIVLVRFHARYRVSPVKRLAAQVESGNCLSIGVGWDVGAMRCSCRTTGAGRCCPEIVESNGLRNGFGRAQRPRAVHGKAHSDQCKHNAYSEDELS